MVRQAISRALTVLLVIVLLSLALGQVLGQPVLIAYVDSESMEPTIDEGDGFLTVPSVLAGPPQEGDVITFHAEEVEGGGLTTHRVVGQTGEGYITQGDANPFTDQDGGEPPVREDQIVSTAVQVGGTVVTVPYFGTVSEAILGVMHAIVTGVTDAAGLDTDVSPGTVGLWVFGIGLLLFLVSLRPTGDDELEREMTRSMGDEETIDGRKVALLLLVIMLVPANAAMLVPSGPTDVTIDGDEVAEAGGVEPGDPVEAEFDVRNDGLITLLIVFEPADEGVTVEPATPGVPPGETATATMTAPAPEPGVERTVTITEHRYIVLFPEWVLVWLHGIHPYVALGALNLLIGAGSLGFVGGLLGFREIRPRDTSRDVPLRIRLKQWLR